MARDILKNPPRYKARFSAHASVYRPRDEDVKEISASVERLKALMPEGVNPEEHPTLLHIVGNLFVAGLANLNDDALSLEDSLRVYRAFANQQVNIEHNRGEIKGFVIKAGLSELGTDRIITEEEARAANRPFNVAIVVALWKVADKDLVNYILQSAEPGSPTKDDLSFSFEVGFDDYSVVVLPKGTSNLALATETIPSSSPDFPKWDAKLRVNKGSGQTGDGKRVARVLVGDIIPLGAGIVAVPAAAVKGLTPITENPNEVEEKDDEDEVEAKLGATYSYSSTQCTLSKAEAIPFDAFGATIPDEHLYTVEGSDEGKYGRENEPHITTLYGLMGNDAELLGPILANFGPVRATLGEISAFENEDKPYDVLKIDVISDDLHKLHALIKCSCECCETYPVYTPHLTVAYLKKGYAKQYIGDKRFAGMELSFNSITFSPAQGSRAELPLVAAAQEAAPEVYTEGANASSPEDPFDLMSAVATRHLKLSPGWQERLATIWTPSEGKDPLPQGVDVTLSDGRTLKSLKVFDAQTLELDKETSFQGVIITDMTPGVPPQADDSKAIHPNLGDVYPNKRPEKVAQEEGFRAEQERAQKAAYTDASLALEQAIAKLSELFTFITQNVAAAGVSTAISPSMDLNELKTLQASVQASDKIEDLKTAFANVALFASEIAKASEEMAKARKDAETAAASSNAALAEVKAQLEDLATKHNELVAAQAAAAAEQVYQERMASVAETFAFDDETRAEVVSEIKACADDEAFTKWMTRAKKLYKGWLKAEDMKHEKAPPFGKEKEKEDEEAECAKAAREAIASAAAKVVDAPVGNTLDSDAIKNGQSLKEKLMAVASKNIRIGGQTVETLTQEATAAKRNR
jgi:hypothetical protein